MFPFWMESVFSSLPQLLALLVGSMVVVFHVTTAHH